MYLAHFGLDRRPFENVPNADFFFESGQYARTLAFMRESVALGRGLMVISGPIGAGKTTLTHMLVSDLGPQDVRAWLLMPPAESMELFAYVARETGGALSSGAGSAALLHAVRERCADLRAKGRKALLLIDEAHLATPDFLEGVRILCNLEDATGKLLQIFLVGQEELPGLLEAPDRVALAQRVAAWLKLAPMTPEQVAGYVTHRITAAGGPPDLFTPQALEMTAEAAHGTPRVVNNLCDRALSHAAGRAGRRVKPQDLHEAARDLGLGQSTRAYLSRNGSPEVFTRSTSRVWSVPAQPCVVVTPPVDAPLAASTGAPAAAAHTRAPAASAEPVETAASAEPAPRPGPPTEASLRPLLLQDRQRQPAVTGFLFALVMLLLSALYYHSLRGDWPWPGDILSALARMF
ncbi:ExeA family protein [Nitratidesulfovibrio sp. D1]|uniref:ExeA family protein n=1 Tax=Nitratidesulfovibrio sp. D1 TaxID=3440151 RepID=UPI003EBB3419